MPTQADFPHFSYSSIIIFEKMDTVIRVYSLVLLFIGLKTSLYGLNTSLVGQRTLH